MTHTPEEKPQGQHPDRAVISKDEDRYGFTYIATELACAIQGIGREGSAVIGIEGAWGTGKTSLLNLLCIALDEQKVFTPLRFRASTALSIYTVFHREIAAFSSVSPLAR